MRTMNLDLAQGVDPPEAGWTLRTPRKRYRITGVRPVDSFLWPNRWALTLEEIALDAVLGVPEWTSSPYRRGESPEDFFGPWVDEEGPET